MNFQQVMNAPGQYIQLQATITDIKHMSGEYGSYALGKAQDNQGQVSSVMFTCKKDMQFPTGLAAGHKCNWAGKYDANTQKMKLFFGSMAQSDVAAQAPVPAPPQSQQQAPPPQQRTNGNGNQSVSIERQVVVKAVGHIFQGEGSALDIGTAIKWCCYFHKWIQDGKDIPVMTEPANGEPPVSDDDIPF